MQANGHASVWRTHIGVGRATDPRVVSAAGSMVGSHKAAHHDAKLATLKARWDARREAVTPFRAEAAPEMVAAQHTLSVATMFYGLAL